MDILRRGTHIISRAQLKSYNELDWNLTSLISCASAQEQLIRVVIGTGLLFVFDVLFHFIPRVTLLLIPRVHFDYPSNMPVGFFPTELGKLLGIECYNTHRCTGKTILSLSPMQIYIY